MREPDIILALAFAAGTALGFLIAAAYRRRVVRAQRLKQIRVELEEFLDALKKM